MGTGRILEILGEAKKLARVAEHEAAVHLRVELAVAREAGYDATEVRDGVERRLHIKDAVFLKRRYR